MRSQCFYSAVTSNSKLDYSIIVLLSYPEGTLKRLVVEM